MLNEIDIDVEVTVKDVRKLYLRIHRDRRVTLTIPVGTKEETWKRFLEEKKDWIAKTLSEMPKTQPAQYVYGETHYLLGVPLRLHVVRNRASYCRVDGHNLWIFIRTARTNREKLWAEYCAKRLDEILEALILKWMPVMGVEVSGFTIKRTKSRWGSCNTKTHELAFALALASKTVPEIESVVVHELNHLIERPHSPRFHALMTHWLPDWKERKKKLSSTPTEFM